MQRTRVLLADDHALVRAGIRALLEKQADMEVVGEAADGRQAVEQIAALRPDVIVMDIAMPGTGGIEATKQIRSQYPDVQILALTMLEDERYFFQIVQAGASGLIIKGALPNELLSALRAVAAGKVYIYPSLTQNLLDRYLSQAHQVDGMSVAEELTDRERQIVRLYSEGHTGKEIAAVMAISPRTVDRHRQNVMEKLNLHSRAELVRYAIRTGLIDSDS